MKKAIVQVTLYRDDVRYFLANQLDKDEDEITEQMVDDVIDDIDTDSFEYYLDECATESLSSRIFDSIENLGLKEE